MTNGQSTCLSVRMFISTELYDADTSCIYTHKEDHVTYICLSSQEQRIQRLQLGSVYDGSPLCPVLALVHIHSRAPVHAHSDIWCTLTNN